MTVTNDANRLRIAQADGRRLISLPPLCTLAHVSLARVSAGVSILCSLLQRNAERDRKLQALRESESESAKSDSAASTDSKSAADRAAQQKRALMHREMEDMLIKVCPDACTLPHMKPTHKCVLNLELLLS